MTTATAMEVLGPQFRFHTYLEHDGKIADGILDGNLYIRGTGDPTLGSDRFKPETDSVTLFSAWADALREKGIYRIRGKIKGDASFFDERTVEDSWIWGDVGNYYGAGVSGLNWNENYYRIRFKPSSQVGLSAAITDITPPLPGITFLNHVTTGPAGSGDKTVIRPGINSGTFLITGTVPRVKDTFTIRGALFNPDSLAARLFGDFLRKRQFLIDGGNPQAGLLSGPDQRTVLYDHVSPPLTEICRQTNWWSVNIYAEALLKTIGKKTGGMSDFKSSVEALKSFWAKQGADLGGFYIKDGSGLSPSASVTPRNLADILTKASRLPSFSAFRGTIAVAGVSGTVRNKGFGTRKNVLAKSGSIEGTRAYAGYVTTRSGETLGFALIAHRYDPDGSQEVGEALMELVRLLGEL